MLTPRRQSLKTLGIALAAASTVPADTLEPASATTPQALTKHRAALPRRRDFT